MEQRVARSLGRLAALAALSASVVLGTSGGPPPAEASAPGASGPGIPVVVGFLSSVPEKACVNHRYKVEYYVAQHVTGDKAAEVALAPVVPIDPVQVAFTATVGVVFPASEPVGPFKAYGQQIVRTITYKATSVGSETLTVKGVNAGGSWTGEMTFQVVKCKAKVRASADMSPVTSVANAIGDGLWTMVASLDVEGEAEVGESSVTGSGTGRFFMMEQFEGVPQGVMTCSMSPAWQGSSDLTITGDAAVMDDAQLALTLDLGSIALGATRIQCSGIGGMGGGFDLPAGELPAVAVSLEPLPMEGGTVEDEIPYGQYQLPLTVSVVQREVAS